MLIVLVIVLDFMVDILLLIGTEKMCGGYVRPFCTATGAFVGALYSGCCLLPWAHFLGNILLRMLSLVAISAIAFGVRRSFLRKCAVFIVLNMALYGLSSGFRDSVWATFLSCGMLWFMCNRAIRQKRKEDKYLPVELCHNGRCIRFTALRDTGNTLCDPITGRPVLIVGAEIADALFGLSNEQLTHPIEAMCCLSGMQLIPYRTVGQDSGLMLAKRLQHVTVGDWKGSMVVAFAPVVLNAEGLYQGLTGGSV